MIETPAPSSETPGMAEGPSMPLPARQMPEATPIVTATPEMAKPVEDEHDPKDNHHDEGNWTVSADATPVSQPETPVTPQVTEIQAPETPTTPQPAEPAAPTTTPETQDHEPVSSEAPASSVTPEPVPQASEVPPIDNTQVTVDETSQMSGESSNINEANTDGTPAHAQEEGILPSHEPVLPSKEAIPSVADERVESQGGALTALETTKTQLETDKANHEQQIAQITEDLEAINHAIAVMKKRQLS